MSQPTKEKTRATTGDAPPKLELDNVSKRYGSTVAVTEVNLALRDGEFLTFLGQSGSGKTTVLKMIAGFEHNDTGTIRISGVDVAAKPPRDRQIGMVFQQYALFPHLTVAENIAYGLRRRRWPAGRRRARVSEMLELVSLADLGGRLPRQLSGGQQQRVAVARALAPEPELLLMDEPLGALDRALRLDLEHEIRRIHRSTGCSVLYVTHDRDEALALSDRIAVFHAGRLVGVDTPRGLYERPTTGYVARLLTDANLVPLPARSSVRDGPVGTVVDTVIDGKPVSAASVADSVAGASLAIPRAAITSAPARHAGGLRTRARLADAVFLGDFTKLTLDHDELGTLIAHVPIADAPTTRPGEPIELSIDLDRCLVVR